MKKVAVLLADGFEEGEALLIVDILRRASFECDMVSIKYINVVSTHGIKVQADKLISEIDRNSYAMIVLPGGQPGADNLGSSDDVINWVKDFDKNGKFIAAICASPLVLARACVNANRKITSYPALKYKELLSDSKYLDEIVVIDNNIITSRGPATTLPFAFTLVDILGGNSEVLKEGMLYNELCKFIKG